MTPNKNPNIQVKVTISIHTLLAESDYDDYFKCDEETISIHTLLAESDKMKRGEEVRSLRFQSTLSSQRVTLPVYCLYKAV